MTPQSSDTTACTAPFTALYLRPDGRVAACCGGWHVLGTVTGPTRQSLREIWRGGPAAQLRDALAAGDFGLGCWECGALARSGRRSESLAASFDRFAPDVPSSMPTVIDFAMSNRCNLECVMCNGGLSSSIRSHREHREPLRGAYDDRFFEELGEFLPHLRLASFKGGEPFLAPENRRVWNTLLENDLRPEISVTTNGTVWSREIGTLVERLGMNVIMSVDAIDPSVLRRIRVNIDPERFWRNVERFQRSTTVAGTRLDLHFCLMSVNWAELAPFLVRAHQLDTGAKVIWVDGPARFNLLTAPLASLEHAMAHLLEADSSLPPIRPDLRSTWDGALRRIEAAITARREEASPVVLRPTGAGPSLTRELRTTTKEEISRSEPAPVELRCSGDVIRTVTVPTWAEWLGPRSWVGRGLDELITVISESDERPLRSEVESLDLGVHRVRLVFADERTRTELNGWYFPDEVPGDSTILLVPVAARDS
ncbi:MAG: radical SAM protein [Microthrixaceae bacterium]